MATAIIHMWCDSFRSSTGVSLDGSGETPCLYVHGAAAPTDTHEVDVSYAFGRAWCSSFEELCFVDEGGFGKEEVLKGCSWHCQGALHRRLGLCSHCVLHRLRPSAVLSGILLRDLLNKNVCALSAGFCVPRLGPICVVGIGLGNKSFLKHFQRLELNV